jgi:hypothetical protein
MVRKSSLVKRIQEFFRPGAGGEVESRNKCKRIIRIHLGSINDAAEQSWLQGQFAASNLWIGFTDRVTEGTWEWISGEAVTYTNWAGGEPNDFGGEDYAAMNWNSKGEWNDLNGGQVNYCGIIETAPVPLPSALLLFAPGLAGLAALRRKFRHS